MRACTATIRAQCHRLEHYTSLEVEMGLEVQPESLHRVRGFAESVVEGSQTMDKGNVESHLPLLDRGNRDMTAFPAPRVSVASGLCWSLVHQCRHSGRDYD